MTVRIVGYRYTVGLCREIIVNSDQHERIATGAGFIAALDQSGGSTSKALRLYGIADDAYADELQMFDLIHQMRCRIIASRAFDGDRVIGAILFEETMERQIDGRDAADYLWIEKRVVPFLRVDKGLDDVSRGVQLMKPIPDLDELLERACSKGIFGTKMRSVIQSADPGGIQAIASQQFDVGIQILAAGLMPILEPEIDIRSPSKREAEDMLKPLLLAGLDQLDDGQQVMFKLTLPEEDDFYLDLVEHPKVLRLVALSGGYTRDEANARLARNRRVVASFSRALTEGLSVDQNQDAFNATLDESVRGIYEASIT